MRRWKAGAVLFADIATDVISRYGLARVEVLGALASTLGLWLVTGVLVSESVRRIRAFSSGDAPPVDGKLMVLLGVFGLLTNLALERVLGAHSHGIGGHDCGHGHDHGHAHGGGHDGHDGHDCCAAPRRRRGVPRGHSEAWSRRRRGVPRGHSEGGSRRLPRGSSRRRGGSRRSSS